ncbi:MAG: OadG family protein [Pontiellaceae bacterium]|nr:OadG family protein [Pontiellaceae bacterium]
MMNGLVLMVIGMATVFSFLVLMVFAMNCSAGFFRKFAHLFPEVPAAAPKKNAVVADPASEVAVVLAAIKAKRG